jgi:hypothetical protein
MTNNVDKLRPDSNASDELKAFQFAKQRTPCSFEHGLQENKKIDI